MVDVLIPWRDDGPERAAALRFVIDRWTAIGADVFVGRCPDGGPWVKALAVADALTVASGDVVVVADADVWTVDPHPALDAVEGRRAAWAVPHRTVRRLSPDASTAVLAGVQATVASRLAEPAYVGHAGGGIVVVRRDVYEDCPLDPRFEGWGQEDDSWAYALRCLHGRPFRGESTLWHLWHPPQARKTRMVGSAAGVALARRYKLARANPAAMRAIVDEHKT